MIFTVINVIIANLFQGIRVFVFFYVKSETDAESENYEEEQKPFKNKFINLNIRDLFFYCF